MRAKILYPPKLHKERRDLFMCKAYGICPCKALLLNGAGYDVLFRDQIIDRVNMLLTGQ